MEAIVATGETVNVLHYCEVFDNLTRKGGLRSILILFIIHAFGLASVTAENYKSKYEHQLIYINKMCICASLSEAHH